jgi:hypothetical protein
MPGPEPKRISTIHTMPTSGKKTFNRRTVPIPRRSRKARNTGYPATRLARRHHTLIRCNRAPLPNNTRSGSPRRRLQQQQW